MSASTPSSQCLRRGSTEPLQNQIGGHCQGEIARNRPEEPRDTSHVEAMDEGKDGATAARQRAEGVGEELQEQEEEEEEEEEDVVGVVEGIEMQGQQRQQEEKDELAMEELQGGKRMTLTIPRTRVIVWTPAAKAMRTARTYDLQKDGSCPQRLLTR